MSQTTAALCLVSSALKVKRKFPAVSESASRNQDGIPSARSAWGIRRLFEDSVAGGQAVELGAARKVRKIVLFAQQAIHPARHLGGERALDARRIPADQDRHGNLRVRFVRVRDEPAHARLLVRAGPRLPRRKLVPARIVAALAGPVQNRREHSLAQFRKKRRNVELTLHARLEILALLFRLWILEVIQRSAIRERRSNRYELERRNLNSFAEAGHPRDPALGRRRAGERARAFLFQIVAREFPQSHQPRVARNRIKSHAAAQLFKKLVV